MVLERVRRFLEKSPEQKWLTARFFTVVALSKLPYAPHRVRLSVPPSETIFFWWSYVAASFQSQRGISDYWGDDIGELRFLWRILRPGMTFLDVGAYHGIYTVVAAKRLGRGGKIVAFEPSARERRRLKVHLQLNRLPRVAVEPYALSSQNEKRSFYRVVSGPVSMNSLRHPAVQEPVEEVPVTTVRLDDYLKQEQMEQIDLAKIDTEGGELELFAGAQDMLSRLRPMVICEVLDFVTRPWGYPAREIIAQLREYDYEWFEFRQDGSLFAHQPKEEYPEVRNYLAVPREKLSTIREWVTS